MVYTKRIKDYFDANTSIESRDINTDNYFEWIA